jgi:uncharacterized protein YgfB (UPF0149 family)
MQATEYMQIQQALTQAHCFTDAAEAHGTLCGCLCATANYRFGDWMLEFLPDGRPPSRADAPLRALYAATADALEDKTRMEFAPLLPDDDAPINDRAEALGSWVRGFLYGLGASQLTGTALPPGTAGELVRDLTEITRVATNATGDEADEDAYTQLVEFVRVGVQMLFDELEPLRRPAPPSPDDSLH